MRLDTISRLTAKLAELRLPAFYNIIVLTKDRDELDLATTVCCQDTFHSDPGSLKIDRGYLLFPDTKDLQLLITIIVIFIISTTEDILSVAWSSHS